MIERQRFSPIAQLAFLLVLAGTGLVLGSLIAGIVGEVWFHVPLSQPAKGSPDTNADIELFRIQQLIISLFLFIIPTFVFTYLVQGKGLAKNLAIAAPTSPGQLLCVVIMFFASLYVGHVLELLNQNIPLTKGLQATFKQWEDDYNGKASELGTIRSGGEYFVSLFILALVPAFGEELLFRGCLQKVIVRITRNVFVGILITSVLFSLMHGSYYGFLVRLFLGGLLGYIYYYGKNIWLNITVHFLNNAFVITLSYFAGSEAADTDKVGHAAGAAILLGLVAAVALVFLFRLLIRETERINAGRPQVDDLLFQDNNTHNFLL